MRRVLFVVLVSVLDAATGAGRAAGNPGASRTVRSNAQGQSVNAPDALTYKILSNPYCYQPDPALNQCVINIRYAQITDDQVSAPYMLRWVVSINSQVRLVENLFFEGSVYYSYDMAPTGLKVPCGAANAGGGGAQYGNNYQVKAEPLDTTGASMGFDQASLFCPAYAP